MSPVKIHPKIMDSEVWEDVYQLKILIFLMLKAKQRATAYKGVKILRGQVVAGRGFISSGTGLGEQVVRTRVAEMKKSETISYKVHEVRGAKFTVITINNFDEYQKDAAPKKASVTPYMRNQKALMAKPFSDDFEEWFSVYKKGNKRTAWLRWQQVELPPLEELINTTNQYIEYCNSIERTRLDAEGWLNQRFFENEWTHDGQGTGSSTGEDDVKFG